MYLRAKFSRGGLRSHLLSEPTQERDTQATVAMGGRHDNAYKP